MSLGFQFDEIMTGHWTPTGHVETRPLWFAISSSATSLGRFLRTGEMTCRGLITVGGLAERAPCAGFLVMPVRSRYVDINLRFVGADGAPYRYVAMKKLSVARFIHDITTFMGTVGTEEGQVLGRSAARFDLRTHTPALLRSLRVRAVAAMAPELALSAESPSR